MHPSLSTANNIILLEWLCDRVFLIAYCVQDIPFRWCVCPWGIYCQGRTVFSSLSERSVCNPANNIIGILYRLWVQSVLEWRSTWLVDRPFQVIANKTIKSYYLLVLFRYWRSQSAKQSVLCRLHLTIRIGKFPYYTDNISLITANRHSFTKT